MMYKLCLCYAEAKFLPYICTRKASKARKSGTKMAVRCRPPFQTRKPKPLAEVRRRKDKAFFPIYSLSKQKFKYI